MSMTTEPKCDLSKRTDQQNIHRLNQQLNAIWRLGDRDECSIKHVGHAMAALISCGDWTEAVDYTEPWGYYPHGETLEIQKRRETLAYRWGKVADTITRIDNHERLTTQLIPGSDFGTYVTQYLETYWEK
tara:strand:- start:469 stop:858 length:390 start_codon:yes stop_codon:yes gene_type:complete